MNINEAIEMLQKRVAEDPGFGEKILSQESKDANTHTPGIDNSTHGVAH